MLFRSPTPFIFVEYNTLLSLVLVPFPISSSSWKIPHDSHVSNIPDSPRQSGLFTFTSFHNALSKHSFTTVIWLTPLFYLFTVGNSIAAIFYPELQNHLTKSTEFCCLLEKNTDSPTILYSPSFWVQWFLSLPKSCCPKTVFVVCRLAYNSYIFKLQCFSMVTFYGEV